MEANGTLGTTMTLWNLVESRGHSDTVGPLGSKETLVGTHVMITPGKNLLQLDSFLLAPTGAARVLFRHWLALGMALLQDSMLQKMPVDFVLPRGMQVDDKA